MMRSYWVTLLLINVFFWPNGGARAQSDAEMSTISGPASEPRRHFRLRNAAKLDADRADETYAIAKPSLRVGYAASGDSRASEYLAFPRYNSTPYLSATHGNHYVNNYANEVASAYGRFEDAGTLPVGSVIAKDSFSVTESGSILLGPLFLMEKMTEGFNPVSGDWRYTLVNSNGTLLGTTNGEGSARVRYCIGCHLAVEHQDHLYLIPDEYRAKR